MVPWRARISIKHVGLASLTVLLTLITITMHISRTHRTEGTPLYKSASAVVFAELFKLVASLVLSLGECRQHIEQGNASASSIEMRRLLPNDSLASGSAENGGNDRRNNVTINLDRSEVNNEIDHDAAPSTGSTTFLRLVRQIYRETFSSDWYMVALPAFLFTCQGNLAYYASSNLSVPIFQVSYQLKIPITAICSVLMLQRQLSKTQWFSIVMLASAVALIQWADGPTSTGKEADHTDMNPVAGFAAVCLACLSSGFSSVFFERQLKRNTSTASHNSTSKLPAPGIWIRNVQLSLFSLFFGSIIYVFTSLDSLGDICKGFTPLVWIVVALSATAGLTAAVVMKYADNIAKAFAASCSIILGFALSIPIFQYTVKPGVLLGSAAVIWATVLFTTSSLPAQYSPANDTAAEPSKEEHSSLPPSRLSESSMHHQTILLRPEPRLSDFAGLSADGARRRSSYAIAMVS